MTKTSNTPSDLSRRQLLGGIATFPLIAIVSSPPLIAACGSRPPETPLAHLHGQDWVHGAYALYAKRYADVQTSAETSSQDCYRVLAQKGVVALDNLQTREVPFFIRVDETDRKFKLARKVPERLTFTSEMTADDRKFAEQDWKKARDHIHTDYEEIRRLDWAMTRLLVQLQRIRNAIEEGRVEQYRLVEQRVELQADPKTLPYPLPYQVTPKDYDEILLLLLERLEDDRARLMLMEADIVAVGLTVRSTDAGSATLAASIRKVLLAVLEDAAKPMRPPAFPTTDTEKAKYLDTAKLLAAKIAVSPEFATWKAEEREKKLAAFGAFLQVLDGMTGLPTSSVYKTVMNIWKGDKDYLSYLKTAAGLIPIGGGAVARTIADAVEYTEKARKIAGVVVATAKAATTAGGDESVADAKAQVMAQAKGVVLNTASRFALDRADKQLSFFKEKSEITKINDALNETVLMKQPMPTF